MPPNTPLRLEKVVPKSDLVGSHVILSNLDDDMYIIYIFTRKTKMDLIATKSLLPEVNTVPFRCHALALQKPV